MPFPMAMLMAILQEETIIQSGHTYDFTVQPPIDEMDFVPYNSNTGFNGLWYGTANDGGGTLTTKNVINHNTISSRIRLLAIGNEFWTHRCAISFLDNSNNVVSSIEYYYSSFNIVYGKIRTTGGGEYQITTFNGSTAINSTGWYEIEMIATSSSLTFNVYDYKGIFLTSISGGYNSGKSFNNIAKIQITNGCGIFHGTYIDWCDISLENPIVQLNPGNIVIGSMNNYEEMPYSGFEMSTVIKSFQVNKNGILRLKLNMYIQNYVNNTSSHWELKNGRTIIAQGYYWGNDGTQSLEYSYDTIVTAGDIITLGGYSKYFNGNWYNHNWIWVNFLQVLADVNDPSAITILNY